MWVRPTNDNAERVFRAVNAFGAATEELAAEDFARPGTIVQLGIAPTRIDILTRVAGRPIVLSLSRHVPSRAGRTDTWTREGRGAEAPDQRTARGRLL